MVDVVKRPRRRPVGRPSRVGTGETTGERPAPASCGLLGGEVARQSRARSGRSWWRLTSGKGGTGRLDYGRFSGRTQALASGRWALEQEVSWHPALGTAAVLDEPPDSAIGTPLLWSQQPT